MNIPKQIEKAGSLVVDTTESAQSIARILIAGFYAFFLYLEGLEVYSVALIYTLISVGWFWWTTFVDDFPFRKILSTIADQVMVAIIIWNVGDIHVAPFVLLYLWSIVGSGYRFGSSYATLSLAGTTTSYWGSALLSPHWSNAFSLHLHVYFSILLISSLVGYIMIRLRSMSFQVAEYEHQVELAVAVAKTDPLTGLCNRKVMNDTLEQIRAQRIPSYIMFIDLDNFKRINDQYGHQVGDEVLINISKRLTANVRENDIVCRYAGDEFVIIAKTGNSKTVQEMAQRIKHALEDTLFTIREQDVSIIVTGSIGITRLDPETEIASAMSHADRAMYAAKRGGRNRISWYEEIQDEII